MANSSEKRIAALKEAVLNSVRLEIHGVVERGLAWALRLPPKAVKGAVGK